MGRSPLLLKLALLSTGLLLAESHSAYLPPAIAEPAGGARRRGYVDPVMTDGMVFPVARTEWFSVINFANDWHEPRMRLVEGRWQQVGIHEGNDIFAEPGTPVLSATGGAVERIGWTFYSGWRVGIRDDAGRYWFYAHLRRFAPGLQEGTRVLPGSVIGEVGNTGYGSTPGHAGEFLPHLHIGIRLPDDRWVDPYPVMRRLYRAAVRASG